MKINNIILIGGLVVMLTACHENPLKKIPEREAVNRLQKTALQVEKTLYVANADGRHYQLCMENKKAEVDCEKFLRLMKQTAQKDVLLKGITLSDLKDPHVYAYLKEDYAAFLFNTIPGTFENE